MTEPDSRAAAPSAAHANRTEGPVKRARGRPPNSSAQIERRREELIATAYEVFAEYGYHAAGIADIADRLGIGHGTFYRYFENKRDVLDHVFDYAVKHFFDVVVDPDRKSAETLEELREQLTSIGDRLFAEIADKDPRVLRLVVLEAGSIDEELMQRALGLLESLAAAIAPLFSDGVRRGFLRADLDAHSVSRVAVSSVIGGLLATVRSPLSSAQQRAYITTVASLLVDGSRAVHEDPKPKRRRAT